LAGSYQRLVGADDRAQVERQVFILPDLFSPRRRQIEQ
jgi:hypothetical protein